MAENVFSFRTYTAPAGPMTVPFNAYSSFHVDWFWLSYSMVTIKSISEYYANLLILQYLEKPKAYATIKAVVKPVLISLIPLEVQNAFNLNGSDTAVGVQLDVLGKYVGVTRTGNGFFGPITLGDEDFLTLIQMGIIRNNSGSSLSTIQALLYQFFAGVIYVFDYQNMQMSYLINSSVGSQELVQLFITEQLLPRPMGVALSVVEAPIIDMFFGLRTYEAPASPITTPLNSYSAYNANWLFLTYADAVIH